MGKMKIIGLTGSIGMGKTTAAAAFRAMGIPVHDADATVHALLAVGGGGVDAVGAAFPEALRKDDAGNAYIDRRTLGQIVFGNDALKAKLESILHPMARATGDAFVAEMRGKGHPLVVLDIPLLFEIGGEKRVDITICVTAPPEVQRARVLARDGMTAEKFARILAGQMPDAEKRKRADYIVRTDKGHDDMRRQLEDILRRIRTES